MTLARSAAVARLPDWGRTATHPTRGRPVVAVAALAAPGAVLALAVWLFVGPVPSVLAALAYGVLAGWWVGAKEPRALRAVRARRLDDGEALRLRNLAEGLATQLSVPLPDVQVMDTVETNALVAPRLGALAVTTGLLQSYTRTELEAAVAHCLIRLQSHRWSLSLPLALGPPGAPLAPKVGFDDDLAAAAVTRYPPALASAIAKAEPCRGRYAPLWFVADAPSHRPTHERLAELTDL